MGIDSNSPQIILLRQSVAKRFGRQPMVHSDFLDLVADIEVCVHQHISESTLERVWSYSTRGYNTVSRHTLDVLSLYAEGVYWEEYCQRLRETSESESELFSALAISAEELGVGDRIRLGWLPDRECIVRHLGDGRFVAEECHNSKLRPGDTFTCHTFLLGKELILSHLQCSDDSTSESFYVAGSRHGITLLKRI